jgi:hypothetical protein
VTGVQTCALPIYRRAWPIIMPFMPWPVLRFATAGSSRWRSEYGGYVPRRIGWNGPAHRFNGDEQPQPPAFVTMIVCPSGGTVSS